MIGDCDIAVTGDTITKTHPTRERAEREATWLLGASATGFAPPDVHYDGGRTISMARLEPLTNVERSAALAAELAELLARLHNVGVAHRDVHVGNVVVGPDGPRLIDWEFACEAPGQRSYDLHGPRSSVDVPAEHLAHGIPDGVWWASPTAKVRTLARYFEGVAWLKL